MTESGWGAVQSLGAEEDEGDEVGEVDNKKSLLDEARDYNPLIALGEFIDNSLGNFESTYLINNSDGKSVPDLRINIDFQTAKGEAEPRIIYTENSGGVSKKKLKSFVSRTWTQWDELEYPVGAWGRGQLVAFAYFGRHNVVRTYRFDEDCGRIFQFGSHKPPKDESPSSKLPEDYYVERNTHWKVRVYEDVREELPCPKPSAGETVFAIGKLTPEALDAMRTKGFFSELSQTLRKYYSNQVRYLNGLANKINGTPDLSTIEITISGVKDIALFGSAAKTAPAGKHQTLELFHSGDFEQIAKNMLQFPTFPPRWIEFEIPIKDLGGSYVESDESMKIEILTGFMDTLDDLNKEYRGFMIWGNQRLFMEKYVPNLIAANQNKQKTLDGNNLRHHRWKGFVKLYSPKPDLIPWSKPSKWNLRDPFVWKDVFDRILSHAMMPYFDAAVNVYTGSTEFGANNMTTFFQMFNPFEWKKGDLEAFNPIKYTAKDLVNETKQEKLIKKIGESVLSLDKKQIRQAIATHFESKSIEKNKQPSDLKKKKLSISNLSANHSWANYIGGRKSFSDLKPTGNMLKSEWNPFVVDSGENPTEIHQIHWKTLILHCCPDAFYERE